MKKILLLMLILYLPFTATAQEAYAVYTSDGTLTFYYDKQKSSRRGTKYSLNTNANAPRWFYDHIRDIKKVVFTSSFAEARPTSTYNWFGNGVYNMDSLKPVLTEIVGIEYLNTSNVTNMQSMFYGCSDLTNLDLSHFDTSNVTSMWGMFRNCSGLSSLDVSHFDTSNVTNMGGMFYNCSSLTSLDLSYFDTSKVTDMFGMFSGCSGLTSLNVSHFDTSKVTDMSGMFDNCSGLTSLDLSHFDTSNVNNMNSMFSGCSGLTSLNLNHFDTSNVITMNSMFSGCSGLTSLDISHFETSKVTNMSGMFYNCSGLTSLDLSHFDTSNITDMSWMFYGCSALTAIYVGDKWNTEKVISSSGNTNVFMGCSNLVGGAGTTYDAAHVDISYAHIDGGPSNPGYLTDKNATSLLNLQEFIDANAGATDIVDVDLSKFYDVVRDVTLYVNTGTSYRFINGTLSRAETLNAPVMYVTNGSKVEVGIDAIITSQGHLADDLEGRYKVEATIKLNGGSILLSKGKVEGACGGRNHGMVNVMSIDEEDPAVELTNDNDSFIMTGGEVRGYFLCNANKAIINFKGGEINGHYYESQQTRATPTHIYEPLINTYSDIHINGVKSHTGCRGGIPIDGSSSIIVDEFFVSLHGTSKVYLHKGGMDAFIFNVEGRKDGDLVMVGDNYTITQEDMAVMSVNPFSYYSESLGYYTKQECYLELKDNKVYLRFKTDELPNTGCDEEWLQQKLDQIAEQKPTEPVELTICEDGIMLTKNIKVAKDCKAVLTGGPITSAEAIGYSHGAEGLFMVYGEIGFHDISLTFNNDSKEDGCLGYFWLGEGSLELNKGTTVSAKNGTVVGGLGKLDITDAVLFAGGDEMVINSNIITTISDYVELIGQQTYCNGKIAIDMKTKPETGMARSPIYVYVTSSLDLWAPNNSLLYKFYLYKDASINTYENGFMQMQIAGEWNQMAVGSAFVTSTSIGQNDYNKMTFKNMPIDRRAEFVPGSHQVRLVPVSQMDILPSLSGLKNVSQMDPATLYLSSDVVNTVYQPTTINHQNVTFNGMSSGATSRARIHFIKDQTLTISKDGRLTLTNIDVTGEDGSVGFEVYGKLIISENVHMSDLSYPLRVYSGGIVYASACLRSPVSIQFANGLASGSMVIAGTDGYQLTETDLAYVMVEGCELQLDKANNRIITLNGTGIETINDNPRTMSHGGTYDLSGRKIIPTRQGVYIIREGEVTRKVYIK